MDRRVGFMAGTISLLNKANRAAFATPTVCSSTATTGAPSAVEATARFQPASIATSMIRYTPTRGEPAPSG
jgi:hypothetical protein